MIAHLSIKLKNYLLDSNYKALIADARDSISAFVWWLLITILPI